MVRAVWNGAVIAESDATVKVEGNHYLPRSSVNPEYLEESAHHTFCGWKGEASYYTLVVNGQRNQDAAWYYAEPRPRAEQVRHRVAFWHGVAIEE